jgi:hypothetical protein
VTAGGIAVATLNTLCRHRSRQARGDHEILGLPYESSREEVIECPLDVRRNDARLAEVSGARERARGSGGKAVV